MSEVAILQSKEVKVDSPSHNRNVARALKDQEELDQLVKDAGNDPNIEVQEDIEGDHPLNNSLRIKMKV